METDRSNSNNINHDNLREPNTTDSAATPVVIESNHDDEDRSAMENPREPNTDSAAATPVVIQGNHDDEDHSAMEEVRALTRELYQSDKEAKQLSSSSGITSANTTMAAGAKPFSGRRLQRGNFPIEKFRSTRTITAATEREDDTVTIPPGNGRSSGHNSMDVGSGRRHQRKKFPSEKFGSTTTTTREDDDVVVAPTGLGHVDAEEEFETSVEFSPDIIEAYPVPLERQVLVTDHHGAANDINQSELVEAVAVNPRRWKQWIFGMSGLVAVVATTIAITLFLTRTTAITGTGVQSGNNVEDTAELLNEVESLVAAVMDDYGNEANTVLGALEEFDRNGLYDNGLDVRDRDKFLSLSYSLHNGHNEFDGIYYGSEEGMFAGYNGAWGIYREPDNSFQVDDASMQKYYQACVDPDSGEPQECRMLQFDRYIQCIDNCALTLCQNEESQLDCDEDTCVETQTWCPAYEVVEAMAGNGMGFVPTTFYCHDDEGRFSESPGSILLGDGTYGDCLYEDGRTRVNRSLAGQYRYCEGLELVECEVFRGGHRSQDFDPRSRPWYVSTKLTQRSRSSINPSVSGGDRLAFTLTSPRHAVHEDGKRTFKGVFAVDYTTEDLETFLKESYSPESGLFAVIYEKDEPHQIIVSSTRRNTTEWVSVEDPSTACAGALSSGCTTTRVTMGNLSGVPFDDILRTSYTRQEEEMHALQPLQFKVNDGPNSGVYLCRTGNFSLLGFEWRILVVVAQRAL